jgi:DNA-binding response OmpR family regulator
MKLAAILVDDDPAMDAVVHEALRGAAPKVALLTARTGREGAEVLQATLVGSAYDVAVVILDLVLPDTPGLEVLMNLRAIAESKTVPVVVVTQSQSEADIWLSYKAGANAYVVKPASPDALAGFYQEILHFWCVLNQRAASYQD